jgi:hypothetical protein
MSQGVVPRFGSYQIQGKGQRAQNLLDRQQVGRLVVDQEHIHTLLFHLRFDPSPVLIGVGRLPESYPRTGIVV